MEIPRPFDLVEFCDELGRTRGRPIVLVPYPIPPIFPCSGAVFARETNDYVFFEMNTTPLHQEHIVLHEIGHLLCGHEGHDAMAQIFQHVSEERVRSSLARTSYSTDDEREAEVIATLIAERIVRAEPPKPHVVDEHTAEVLRRLESSF